MSTPDVEASVTVTEAGATTEPGAADVVWMREALAEADLAPTHGDVPVGCVLVDASGKLIARAHNLREQLGDPTAHAELLAIRAACAAAGSWRLEGVTAYVTLEPCAMCAGALVHTRMARVVYGCADPKSGAIDTLFTIGQDPRLNHRFTVTAGVLAEDCASRLRAFFAALRAQGKK